MVILEAGEDDNSWLNNAEVLQGTILDDPHQNIGKKEPIENYLAPLIWQSGVH